MLARFMDGQSTTIFRGLSVSLCVRCPMKAWYTVSVVSPNVHGYSSLCMNY